jgi:hypothetical protein
LGDSYFEPYRPHQEWELIIKGVIKLQTQMEQLGELGEREIYQRNWG